MKVYRVSYYEKCTCKKKCDHAFTILAKFYIANSIMDAQNMFINDKIGKLLDITLVANERI